MQQQQLKKKDGNSPLSEGTLIRLEGTLILLSGVVSLLLALMKEDLEIEACKFLDDARVASACHRLPLPPRATFQVHKVKEVEISLLCVENLHGKFPKGVGSGPQTPSILNKEARALCC